MRRLNYVDPDSIVGKGFGLFFRSGDISIPYGKIVGVVEDFHLSTLKREVEPLVLFKREKLWLINIVIAFQPGKQTTALTDLERVWNEMFPEYPLDYEYVDSMYRDVYSTEILQANLLTGFTLIAWLSMRKWLESFVYKTDLSWWLFALAGGIAVTIALLTVSIQTWRASRRNPVEALRYE